jgi:hypothetical protein
MQHLILVSVLIAFLGLAFILTSFRRLIQRRYIPAAGLMITALLLLIIAVSAFLLASNLDTYKRLNYDQAVAEVAFQKLSEQQYRAVIRSLESGHQQVVDISGDEWQLGAQLLDWQGMLTIFGTDASYRLRRISGRHADTSEQQQQLSSTSLVPESSLIPGSLPIKLEKFDLWQFADSCQDWLYGVAAGYSSMVFLPMTDGARYDVAISENGLVARPANDEARKAVSRWIGRQ